MPTKKRKISCFIFAKLPDSSIHFLFLKTGPDRQFHWQPVTGKVEEGESFVQAAQREVFEETSLIAPLENFIFTKKEFFFTDRWGKEAWEYCFYLLLDSPFLPEIKIDPVEHQEFKWCLLEELHESDFFYPTHYEVFSYLKQKLFNS